MKRISFLLLPIFFLSCVVSKNIIKDTDASTNESISFFISDGSSFESKDFYPKFSWETTPMYYMFGDGVNLLTPNQVKTISDKTTFICIEKNHAFKTLKYAEIGAKKEIAAFKAVNPDIKALFYFNSAYAWPFTSYNKNFTKKKIDQHPELKKFLIKKPNSEELENRNNIFQFDVLNPEFRDWWVKTVAQGVSDSGADGVFIDQMHAFVWLRNSQKKEVEKAMGEMMMNLKKAIGSDKILLGNNASHVKDVFPAIDAAMFEHYNAKKLSKENILKEWDYMFNNAKAGKMSIFRIGVEAEWDNAQGVEATVGVDRKSKEKELERLSKERLEYYQACFLIGAQPYSYFQYGWGWRLGTGPLVDYPELQKPLGKPKGSYTRASPDDWEFTREFDNASVWVNLEKKQAKIDWK
jgi:hypothetical protein